jgi:serine/threonine protein kinase
LTSKTTLTESDEATHAAKARAALRTYWPDALAYREAVQDVNAIAWGTQMPGAVFDTDKMGLPLVYTGRFAAVFRATSQSKKWAVRFFTIPDATNSRIARYETIEANLAARADTRLFVPFRHEPEGIKIGGTWYPMIVMEWAEGTTLGKWVEAHLDQPKALRRLAFTLEDALETLESHKIAHGDWQHDNILVSENGKRIQFVDYDGMYLPDFAGQDAPELGHPNYQHPDRRPEDFGVGLDRFACQSLLVSLHALALDPTLRERFSEGDSLVLEREDYRDVRASKAFATLKTLSKQDPLLATELAKLESFCQSPFSSLVQSALPPEVAIRFTDLQTKEAMQEASSEEGEPWWQDFEGDLELDLEEEGELIETKVPTTPVASVNSANPNASIAPAKSVVNNTRIVQNTPLVNTNNQNDELFSKSDRIFFGFLVYALTILLLYFFVSPVSALLLLVVGFLVLLTRLENGL